MSIGYRGKKSKEIIGYLNLINVSIIDWCLKAISFLKDLLVF